MKIGRITLRQQHRQRGVVHLTALAIILLGLVVIVYNRHKIEKVLVRSSQHIATQIKRVSAKIIGQGQGMMAQILRGNFSLHDPNDVAVTPGLFDNFWGDDDGMVMPPLIFSPLMPVAPNSPIAKDDCAAYSPRVDCQPVVSASERLNVNRIRSPD
jgi:hypothetical protein